MHAIYVHTVMWPLPEELTLFIFTLIPKEVCIDALFSVCQAWRRIALDRTMHDHAHSLDTMDHLGIDQPRIAVSIQHHLSWALWTRFRPCVTRVQLSVSLRMDDMLKMLETVEEAIFTNVFMDKKQNDISHVFPRNERLIKLTLFVHPHRDSSIQWFPLNQFPSLVELKSNVRIGTVDDACLVRVLHFWDAGPLTWVSQLLIHMKFVEDLYLETSSMDGTYISYPDRSRRQYCPKLPCLKTLRVNHTTVPDLLDFLTGCPMVETVSINTLQLDPQCPLFCLMDRGPNSWKHLNILWPSSSAFDLARLFLHPQADNRRQTLSLVIPNEEVALYPSATSLSCERTGHTCVFFSRDHPARRHWPCQGQIMTP